jgi:predicted nucleic acid-binding protein
MPADLLYFDTSYLVRLYLDDPGFNEVRDLAAPSRGIAAAWHARAEVVAALHRAYRERRMDQEAYLCVLDQFLSDSDAAVFRWLVLTEQCQLKVERVFREASTPLFLRAADALHLACAAENGFDEVYSSDRHFLAAAPLFGLRGVNVIGNAAESLET